MSKFGWDASKGLGAEGDGRTTHLKVAQKLDMLGIGAAHTRDPNGIAWKQNRDFERLLARLNGNPEEDGMKVDGFARAAEEEPDGVAALVEEDEDAERKARKERKREKRAAKEAAAGEGKTIKKRKAGELDEQPVLAAAIAAPVASMSAAPVRGCRPHHTIRCAPSDLYTRHRARHVRAKRMALADSVAMAEVLGIAPASSTAAAAAAIASDAPVAMPSGVLEEMEKLTTSTKSVMDYFKEKLLAKSNGASGSGTPAVVEEDEGLAPRRGLGATRPALGGFTSFSTARVLGQPSEVNRDASPLAEVTLPLAAGSSLADDAAMKKAAKRARKEAKRIAKEATDVVVVATAATDDAGVEPPSSLDEDSTPVDDDAATKAAKRARKEAKQLAKTVALDHSSPQDHSKEDRKRRRREERASAVAEA
jgi:Pin2-interacting protein X1